ncbi:dihydroorotate dehydrogenase electron transfer subunit [Pigmentiphaga sp.]|jgi:2-polyprenylphenol hydroxylase and related flavodoxin oxidoreductases|uniref:dihydroorotate dehydrogenase electron transfer subunit n=1 Tax=Pigmentiphaga sp. TaxID=1977564 RepID=UPI0025CEDB0C|nr:dihydroorotate dehydrogenase electron transfer subunit [Pigmentiphaga sp.]MBX6319654.1 dihydroorotate dehydrogenase electron transfer subunit [Pigmentiphaga sp.]
MNVVMSAPRAGSCIEQSSPDTCGRVISNEWVNPDYKHLVLDAGWPAAGAKAGQFFHLLCPSTDQDAPFFRRPMSTYRADPATGRVEFLYKVTGAGTRGLATLAPGDKLPMLGPLGVGFTLPPQVRHIVVLGRGVGLATLAPLAELASTAGVGVTAILSARNSASLMSQDRFAAIGATLIEVTDAAGTSSVENVERLLRELHAAGRADAFYTCGSARLTALMRRLGKELAVPGEVAMEQQMACGLGMCYCCVRAFRVDDQLVSKRVCWDGPVFPLAEVV